MKYIISLLLTLLLCVPCAAQNWGAYVKKKKPAQKTTVQKAPVTKRTQTEKSPATTKKTSKTSTKAKANAPTITFSGSTLIVDGVTYEMVKVEAGMFTMGATFEQQYSISDEEPAHRVNLTNNFYLGKTEVTQALWEAVMGSNPSEYTGDNRPVGNVSWNDCQKFINKLNAATGKKFRLPTEAEWEFAARGGNKSKNYQYSGSNNLDDVAWYHGLNDIHDVATKRPNELGIYDMSGNVWEWCQDWYGDYSSSSQTNPTGPSSGAERVIRSGSGSIGSQEIYCRIPMRLSDDPVKCYSNLGLRLALTEEVPTIYQQSGKSEATTITTTTGKVTHTISMKENTIIADGISYDMVKVEAGTFKMGSSDNGPTHQVTLTEDFYIGKTEVTQDLWKAVMGSNPSHFKGDNRPVENISWNDCQTFIKKLNAVTGRTFRLPTEAEWEYAARGGNRSKNFDYCGSNNLSSVAWYSGNSGATHDVATKYPNELGLYDMSGNVWEWCQDWYGTYSTASQTNPTGPSYGSRRVGRGGGWNTRTEGCTSTSRGLDEPGSMDPNCGFRLVLTEQHLPAKSTTITVVDNTLMAKGVPYKLVKVDAGAFVMGATSEMQNPNDNEQPVHKVILTKDYYIGATEVTQALWKAIMGSNPSFFKGDNKPVENVTWHDCQTFIKKLNAATGKKFRLPTEAEWEYAARGGKKSICYQYSGSSYLNNVAWYDGNSGSCTHDVAAKQPNELGLYDMSGNVWEWCQDWYGIYSHYSQTNPKGPSNGTGRIYRGGSWGSGANDCRSSYRINGTPNFRYDYIGFRLVLSE